MVACPSCGTANPDGFRFCGACAAPLTGAPAREERKVVTVLFADLAGFTARSEALDPEDVRAFLLPYYDVLASEVIGHGGHVDRFLGDGIMALFGAPIAHEDDPERAVRAALRILERVLSLGLDLHVRIGINTGPVLFVAGDGGERDDSVTGDTVNTAARLQVLAPLDGVVVGEPTYRATAGTFEYVELPPTVVKGKAEPLGVWRPTAPIALVQREHVEATPFVGRDLELSLLTGLFERARAAPATEFVTILAEAGMGKSRLVRELARYVEALPDPVTWRAGRCLPYGDGIGLWALGEIVKGHAGILDTDDQATLGRKLDAAIVEPDGPMRTWMRERLAPLVGLETSTQPPQQDEAFTAWRRFLEQIAQAGPAILVVEDLHWADDALVAFLSHLAERTTGLPLLLVTTARPELEERHPAWLSRTRRSTVLSLAALPDAAIETLVAGVLPGASRDLLATVLERAAGSPLYAEQLAAMVRERRTPTVRGSLDEAAIPASIAALLAARVDALPADAKAVLLDASVVGRTFWPGAVSALSRRDRAAVEGQLTELVRRELVRPVFPSTMAGEAEFTFWHALLRDVAYGELTRGARLAKHRAAAEWITERAVAALGEDAEIVVYHLDRALELAAATGADGEAPAILTSLVDALLAAGDHATGTQPSRAAGHLRRALDLLEPTDRRLPATLTRLGRAMLATFDYAGAARVFEAAASLRKDRGELVAAAGIAAPLSIALANSGGADRADALLVEACAVLVERPGPELVSVLAEQAGTAMAAGHDELSLSLADEALRVSLELDLPPSHRALMVRGVYRFRSDPDGGEADLRGAIDQAAAEGDLRSAVVALANLAGCRAEWFGPGPGLAAVDEAIAFSDARGLPTEWTRGQRVGQLLAAGAWDEVVTEAEVVRAWAVEHGDAFTRVIVEAELASVGLERGQHTGSLDHLLLAGREAGHPPSSFAPIVAEALISSGDHDAALRALEEGLDATGPGDLLDPAGFVRACLRAGSPALARTAIARGPAPGAVSAASFVAARAAVAEAEGAARAAAEGYADVAARWAALGCVYERAYALAGLGRCLLVLGEADEGIAQLRESRGIWENLKATRRIKEIDTLLATVT